MYKHTIVYLIIITRCTIRNQNDILKTAVANVSKGQADMSNKGEIQTLTKLSMRNQVCPGESCDTTLSERTSYPLFFAPFHPVDSLFSSHVISQ